MTEFKKSAVDHGGPYTAQPSGGESDWWYVADKVGFNCLALAEKPGAKFTTRDSAVTVAERWNAA